MPSWSAASQRFQQLLHLLVTTPRWGLICGLQAASGLASFLGLPLLIPVLEMMQSPSTSTANNSYSKFLVPVLNIFGLEPNFHNMLLFAAILILAGQLLVNVSSLTAAFVREDLLKRYRERVLRDYSLADWPWMTEHHSGRLYHAVTREVEQACEAHINSQRVFINAFQIVVFLAISFRLSWPITMLAIGIYAFLAIVNAFNSKIINRLSHELNHKSKQFSNDIVSFQHNKKFIKVSLLGQKFLSAFDRLIVEMRKIRRRQMAHFEVQRAWNMMSTSILLVVLIFFHQMLSLNYATLLLILFVFMRMAPQFVALSDLYATMDMHIPVYQSLQAHLKDLEVHREKNGSRVFQPPASTIFQHVTFAYPNHPPVFSDLNLTFEPNTVTALVGKSGCGKSTILDLYLGLLPPQSGMIHYGGISAGDLDKDSLRRHVAFVGQRPSLLDGTLKENLTVAKPDATQAELDEVCRQVHLLDFVKSLPEGFEAIVGENGIKLSGGQRQKIALARCLLIKPAILILDEATSELDTESEAKIQETLRHLRSGMTTIVVAHRLSTVKSADRIYVIADGKACESGRYDELMAGKGKFYELVSMQH